MSLVKLFEVPRITRPQIHIARTNERYLRDSSGTKTKAETHINTSGAAKRVGARVEVRNFRNAYPASVGRRKRKRSSKATIAPPVRRIQVAFKAVRPYVPTLRY